ncbi:hypothetical protein GCM10017717_22940 [Deinococcus persicinus]
MGVKGFLSAVIVKILRNKLVMRNSERLDNIQKLKFIFRFLTCEFARKEIKIVS